MGATPARFRRFRRLRRTPALRRLVAETTLTRRDLVYPVFVSETARTPEPIDAMPGQNRYGLDGAVEVARELVEKGISSMMLFGIPKQKSEDGHAAWDPKGIIPRTVRAIKEKVGEHLVVMTDVCLCEYTTHGHCGPVVGGVVDNDRAVDSIARTAVTYAEAGADVVAPSDMMDGRIGACRTALDDGGQKDTVLLAYAAKYASAFYGPYRVAADSAPREGPRDRRTYQIDPANADEAIREVQTDLEEGADMVLVKPALPSLDVIHRVRATCRAPIGAFQVSGEYAMIKAAATQRWIDEERSIEESLLVIKRAGAQFIVTYFARDVAAGLPR